MSKPETPCLPECRYSEGLDGVIKTCAPGCPNAPKAEAKSKPDTPCPIDVCDGVNHWMGDQPYACPMNAPKAEVPPTPKSAACCRAMESHICMKPAQPAPVSEPPKRVPLEWGVMDAASAMSLIAEARAERDALKAQLDTDREVLKETENNISNLSKFAASPITPNYNLPMSGLAIAIRDSLAAALGREILLTQEWDALKAQNATLAAEVERLRDLIVRYRNEQDVYESVGTEGDGDIGVLDAQHDLLEEGTSIRAAREAGKA